MAIAQAIVQAYQGSIEVQSQLGFGSTFILRLPLDCFQTNNQQFPNQQ
ncbi:MAG: hypothetical protein DSM106950_00575 [Stigonema ocellatum SAG 48.90 = DSM 106950]|nr:hypothetical protein [Stigonema ocellatum SAG 48.90 = DSM 106950]